MKYVLVIPDIPKLERAFWYSCDESTKGFEHIQVGSLVRINLHSRRVKGWVSHCSDHIDSEDVDKTKIKPILEYVGFGTLEHLVRLCEKLGRHYLVSPVAFLRSSSPSSIVKTVPRIDFVPGEKNAEQLYLVDARADRRELLRTLISPTGSTLIVAPDSQEKIFSFCKREGYNAFWFNQGSKTNIDLYRRVMSPKSVVIGGRSALFAPVGDCDSIIVLDDSYEQLRDERSPQWHALDVARMMGAELHAKVSVVTSVPSVMTQSMETVDMRTRSAWPGVVVENRNDVDPMLGMFGTVVVNTINKCVDMGMDAVILTNSISASKLLLCSECGHIATCGNCHHSMQQRETDSTEFQCTVCHETRPPVCLHCKSTLFKKYRKGVKAIAADAQKLFGRLKVLEAHKGNIELEGADTSPRLFVATEAFLHHAELTRNVGAFIFLDFDAMLLRPSMNAFNQSCVLVNRAIRILKKSDLQYPIVIATQNPYHEIVHDIEHREFQAQRQRELDVRKQLKLAPYFATAEVTSDRDSINEFVSAVDSSIIVGKMDVNDENSRVMLKGENHEMLAVKTYVQLRKLASKSRYVVAVDVYE